MPKTYSDLPEPVRAHLSSPEISKQMRALMKPLNIAGEKILKFGAILNAMDMGELKIEQLPTLLEKNLSLAPEQAHKAAADIAGFRYLPIADHMKTNVAERIREWGRNPDDFSPARAKPSQAQKAASLPALSAGRRPSPESALPAAKKFQMLPGTQNSLQKMNDDEEISQIKSEMKTDVDGSERMRKESIENIAKTAKLSFSTPEMEERWKKIIDSRLRDVRDMDETRAMLVLPKEKGGLGLAADAADKLSKIIESEWTALSAKLSSDIKRQAISNFKAEAEERKKKQALQKQKAAAERSLKIFEQEKSKAAKNNEEILVPGQARRPETSPSKAPKPVLSPASTPAKKEQVTDLVPPPKLTGPIDELRRMTMKDFRRLSKNPQSAAQKIKDRIILQKEEGFDKYARAVDAWHNSVPYGLYLKILNEMLSGKPASEGSETLTKEEWSALLSLERDLRYNV